MLGIVMRTEKQNTSTAVRSADHSAGRRDRTKSPMQLRASMKQRTESVFDAASAHYNLGMPSGFGALAYTQEKQENVGQGHQANESSVVKKVAIVLRIRNNVVQRCGSGEGGSQAIKNALPNVENATINPKKLTEYALNPDHPVGGNKAKVFERALGYNQSNADDLMRQIYEKLPNSEAVLGKLDEYGQRYTVDILISGPNGNTVNVRTGWIIKTGSDVPELTTLFVND